MLLDAAGIGGYNAQTVALIAAGMAAAIAASVPQDAAQDPDDVIPAVYDITTVSDYFRARPVLVARRTTVVLQAASRFGLSLLLDQLTGNLERTTPLRATQLRQTIERLGPAYVKVAQALSTRVDILSAEYLVQIEQLQDRVPPFPTGAALKAMERGEQ
jgi:aarF domain-containing kinase